MDIPVYLFVGFLDSGKTKFIDETLKDPRFESKDTTLLLLCEDGEEEYDTTLYSGGKVIVEEIESEDTLSIDYLDALIKKTKATRVIVEYNGMWMLQSFYDAMPKEWILYQEFMLMDATTAVSYNANMRSLVVDKLTDSELIIFNRYNDNIDKMALHKIVRGISRKASIAYEYADGSVAYDDIEDPLPFDIEADIINIEDKDFAIWYRDLSEELPKYDGKTVKFKGIVAKNPAMPKGSFVIGRHVMTCCADDITYSGLVCDYSGAESLKQRDWVIITAKLELKKHKMYGKKGPVLTAINVVLTSPANPELATFY
ncbi:MAG: GTPase [Ruminococcaceae bacterium]|nr:GTPase [Oscillospiraceae bacterium]